MTNTVNRNQGHFIALVKNGHIGTALNTLRKVQSTVIDMVICKLNESKPIDTMDGLLIKHFIEHISLNNIECRVTNANLACHTIVIKIHIDYSKLSPSAYQDFLQHIIVAFSQ